VTIFVLIEPWRAHPLAWIHRTEARAIARELGAAGGTARLLQFRESEMAMLPQGPLLLRMSDPVMLAAAHALSRAGIRYVGPGAPALERCYDKYAAWRVAVDHGIDTPATVLASQVNAMPFPLVLKPRRGSDSI